MKLSKMVLFPHLLLVAVILASFLANASLDESVETQSQSSTEAFKERWRILFGTLDGDKNGIYTVNECFSHIEKLTEYLHASGNLVPGLKEICMLYTDVVEAFYTGSNTPKKKGLTETEFVRAFGNYRRSHFDEFKRREYEFFNVQFHAMDSDGDGVICFDEFQYYYKIFGDSDVMKKKAMAAFKVIDADGDGRITEDEYCDAYLTYFLDPDVTAKELSLY